MICKLNSYKLIFLYCTISIVLSSCKTLVSPSDLVFLQKSSESVKLQSLEEYKIQPRDLLSIKIITPEAVDKIGGTLSNANIPVSPGALYITNYTVSDQGMVTLPTIGKIKVEGETVGSIEDKIMEKIKVYLTEFSIVVKLVNFRVSVLGEVTKPGMYYFYENKVSAFDAISMAGGFDTYADRTKIRIVRMIENKAQEFVLNTQSIDIASQKGFILTTGDIIYIEPLRAKSGSINRGIVSSVLSAVSILVTLYSVATR